MSDIQKARDVLAKWRDDSISEAQQPWRVVTQEYGRIDVHDAQGYPIRSDGSYADYPGDVYPSVARLIVGTAGNPELLDAIDAMLASATDDMAEYGETPAGLWNDARRIASAILSADERMRS